MGKPSLGVWVLATTVLVLTYSNQVQAGNKLVCYYGSWAVYRPGDGKFDVENIDASLCTHIIYSFIGLGDDNKVKVLDAWNDSKENGGKGAMQRFTGLKSKNSGLKALVAIGGWNEGSEKYSRMVSSASSRRTFIDSVVPFLKKEGFDGLDLDWEYPANRGGKPEDKENFVKLLAELRAEFKNHGFLLTAAVSAGENTINTAYDVPGLARYLDWINVMTYDFHGAWDPFTHHNTPLYAHPQDASKGQEQMNVDHAIKTWMRLGAPSEKLVLGMGTYGRGFNLQDANNNGIYAPTSGGIEAGPYTRESGFWGYNEICEKLRKEEWTVKVHEQIQAPYAYRGTQWIGYEDPRSIAIKANYARENNLGGGMIWSLETDDFRGNCGQGTYPLLKAIKQALGGGGGPNPGTTPEPVTTASTEGPRSTGRPTTGTTQGPGEVCQKEGYNRDPNDCEKFYYCQRDGSGWRKYEYKCAPGTAFNPNIDNCGHKYNVPGC